MSRNQWRTAIAQGSVETIRIRGYDIKDMIGRVSFAEAFLLLARGELPTPGEGRVLDAIFVAVIDHGIVPGSIVTRYLASAGSPIQAAVGGGILSIGDTYGGAGEQLGAAMALQLAAIERGEHDEAAAASAIVAHFAALGLRVPGFGHPMHTQGDPRVARLMAVADENGVSGRYCALARAVEATIAAAKRRPIPMNVDGRGLRHRPRPWRACAAHARPHHGAPQRRPRRPRRRGNGARARLAPRAGRRDHL